jgi:hypothetical protein
VVADVSEAREAARELGGDYRLRVLLGYAVMHAHATGDDAEAVERLRDMMFLGRVVGRRGYVTAHLVALSIAAHASSEAEALAKGIRVDASPGAAGRQQVDALIRDFLEIGAVRENLLYSLRRERPLILTHAPIRRLSRGYGRYNREGRMTVEISPRTLNVAVSAVARPWALLAAARSLRYNRAASQSIQQIDETSPPALPASAPTLKTGMFGVEWVADHFDPPDLGRVPSLHRTAMSERGSAAVSLARRLFEFDHGRQPRTTSELIPDYIPADSSYLPSIGTGSPATGPASAPARR